LETQRQISDRQGYLIFTVFCLSLLLIIVWFSIVSAYVILTVYFGGSLIIFVLIHTRGKKEATA